MYNDDYIIAVDENGQPYIAHADWGELSGRAVKYIKKFIGPNGKMRYIYDTAVRKGKTAAKKAWGSKVGRWIDSHDAGITEEIMRKRLHRKARKAEANMDARSASRYANRAAELRKEAKTEREAAKAAVRRRTEPLKTKAKDVLGYDEKERYEKLMKSYQRLAEMAQKDPGSVSKNELERRHQDMLDARKAYTRTAKGALDYIQTRRKIRKSAGK